MEDPIYRIPMWRETFETGETRKLKQLTWCAMPNKHDGLSFRRMSREENSAELFAAWVLIVQVSSKGKADERGALIRDGRALTADDLAAMTSFPEEIFIRALNYFSSPKIGWLTVEKPQQNPQSPDASADSAGLPAASAGLPAASAAKERKKEREYSTEKKEREGGETPASNEIPDRQQAIAQTMTAGIAEDFAGYVYDDWASREGKDGGGNLVKWLPYVVKRWNRERAEWMNGSHKGRKAGKSPSANHRPEGLTPKLL